ncbi:glycosyltransferase family 2 protein, partial [Escherichia coli]|uniref:glycosyltransferase family 2 protein n=1 Tax=Escherichia coli TaxID=562 RepID=UPI0032E427CC
MRVLGYGRTARDHSHADADARRIDQLAVVIPAHNEEQHLERALSRVQAAADAVQSACPPVGVRIVVVLDACTDASPRLARRFAAADSRFEVIVVDFRSVGKTRRAGVQALLPQESAACSV